MKLLNIILIHFFAKVALYMHIYSSADWNSWLKPHYRCYWSTKTPAKVQVLMTDLTFQEKWGDRYQRSELVTCSCLIYSSVLIMNGSAWSISSLLFSYRSRRSADHCFSCWDSSITEYLSLLISIVPFKSQVWSWQLWCEIEAWRQHWLRPTPADRSISRNQLSEKVNHSSVSQSRWKGFSPVQWTIFSPFGNSKLQKCRKHTNLEYFKRPL